MRTALVALPALLLAAVSAITEEPPFWPCAADEGMPFGQLKESDATSLQQLGAANGLNVESIVNAAYAGDKAALEKMYKFSLKLESRDMPTRVYGQMVYSMFLNIGEQRGSDFLISALVKQIPAVRKRIRDFLWYPTFCVPGPERAAGQDSARKQFPLLFPPEYVFGKDDELFSKTPVQGRP